MNKVKTHLRKLVKIAMVAIFFTGILAVTQPSLRAGVFSSGETSFREEIQCRKDFRRYYDPEKHVPNRFYPRDPFKEKQPRRVPGPKPRR